MHSWEKFGAKDIKRKKKKKNTQMPFLKSLKQNQGPAYAPCTSPPKSVKMV